LEAPRDVLDSADVDAARRLPGKDHSRTVAQFTSKHDALLIPTGERRQRRSRPRATDVVFVDERPRTGGEKTPPQQASPGRASGCSTEVEILGHTHLQHASAQLTVLRDHRKPSP